jgi:hypothetical protein
MKCPIGKNLTYRAKLLDPRALPRGYNRQKLGEVKKNYGGGRDDTAPRCSTSATPEMHE